MKNILIKFLIIFCSLSIISACNKDNKELNITKRNSSDTLKPRLVVMTDIAPGNVEPDDMESAVRLMSYADMFEIEAICTTIGWNCDPYPEEWAQYLDTVVDAYSKDVKNLMKRSNQTDFQSIEQENGMQKIGYWPSAEYIKSRCVFGSKKAGIDIIGEGNDSPGSELLIKLANENDPRPIWIASWGGSNTLAQAIWRVKQTATPEELKKIVNKFCIYTITDQDMQYSMRMNRAYSSHQWLRKDFFEDLLFIWDESAWLNQCENGKKNWELHASKIQTQGNLGKIYPNFLWGVEGDTPSFLHVMPNGLGNPEIPAEVTWGGYHVFAISPDSITSAYTNWHEPIKSISNAYEQKFYPDEFNDFASRMAWANDGKGNKNPIININGISSISGLTIKCNSLSECKLDASKTYDEDGDKLTFNWWIQPEAGTADATKFTLENYNTDKLIIKCSDNSQIGKILHIICEVHDNGPFNLVAYRRVVVEY
ncbi:MAG: DUF1593 domain-containing protein [Bacteroidales bacterium]|nr:DUF1593 domain-containing protein [Bacteroidales bacterium]